MLEKKEEEGINFHEKCNHDCIESGQLFLSLIGMPHWEYCRNNVGTRQRLLTTLATA